MNINTVILLLLSVVAVYVQLSSACTCEFARGGTDMCTCSGSVVRPYPVARIPHRSNRPAPRRVCNCRHPKPMRQNSLQPVGDLCSCGNHIVRPAKQPKPCHHRSNEARKNHRYSPQPEPLNLAAYETQYVPADVHESHHHKKHEKKCLTPADPVSQGLALLKATRSECAVPEATLQYGFKKQPCTEPGKDHFDVAEEKLFSVDRDVIELKPYTHKKKKEDSEEKPESSEESEESVETHGHLSYGDIGYGPAKFKKCEFTSGHSHGHYDHVETKGCQDPLPMEPIGHCGFRPGRVVVRDRIESDPEFRSYRNGF